MAYPLSDKEHATIKQQIESQPDLIVGAAIRVGNIIISVERPGRHGECINFLNRIGIDYLDQGFLTNKGKFLTRKEAGDMVTASGQGSTREICNGNLFSEDLWNEWDAAPADLDGIHNG